jgi:cytochrome P450
MGLVWAESSSQATEMLEYFATRFKGETNETIEGLRSIAMNVLGSAGYGTPQPWKQEEKVSESRYKLTYVEAVSAVINNIIPVAVIPARIFSLPIMPDSVQRIGIGLQEFPLRTKGMLEAERKSASSDASPRNNMMSTLVRLSDSAKHGEEISSKSQNLSEEEILGNLFQFTAAGFDTTANTMAYAITILAIEIEWQDWIIEEIDNVVQGDLGNDYVKIFPKLTRCLALMVSMFLSSLPQVLKFSSMKRCDCTPRLCTQQDRRKFHKY